GDTLATWRSLRFQPEFTATASNIGYTWWSHDIGGHMHGIKDDELYLRYVQFGVFNPINRLHSSDCPVYTKEPWAFKNGVGELAVEMLRFRHKLIPYLYSCGYETHEKGLALCEPMYYRHPENEKAYAAPNQYYFGPSLLVAPVITPSVDKGLAKTEVFLPEGFYTDIFTGDTYDAPAGGATYEMVRPLDSIPVLAPAGSVLPLGLDAGNSAENPHVLEAKIFNGNGSYDLYEDRDGALAATHFALEGKEGLQTVTVSASGDAAVIPADRTLILTFPNIEVHNQGYVNDPVVWARRDLCRVTVQKNGAPTEAVIESFGTVRVTLKRYDPTATYTVQVEYEKVDAVERFKRLFWNKILLVESTVSDKEKLDKAIRALKEPTLDTVVGAIKRSNLSQIDKLRLCENVEYRR
ncbi:MAG: glycoside hydrolase family 31 protein, partial [Clostridia bacterium]|nr:glycoside hydrolase family 31 protein [Clostridia bacterium]